MSGTQAWVLRRARYSLCPVQVEEAVHTHTVQPLCNFIETDLRLHIHTGVVKLDDRNPFRVQSKDWKHFFSVPPLALLAPGTIHIKALVTHYLDKTFYNLSTVALHDWKVGVGVSWRVPVRK